MWCQDWIIHSKNYTRFILFPVFLISKGKVKSLYNKQKTHKPPQLIPVSKAWSTQDYYSTLDGILIH